MITIDKSILNRIRGSGAGSVFAPNQFLDLGNRSAVGVALHRLVNAGKIRRIRRGLLPFASTNTQSSARQPPILWPRCAH